MCVYFVEIMVILLESKYSLFNLKDSCYKYTNTQTNPFVNLIKLPYLLLLGLNFVNILKLNLFYAIFQHVRWERIYVLLRYVINSNKNTEK